MTSATFPSKRRLGGRVGQGVNCHGDDASDSAGGSGHGNSAGGASGDNKRVPSTTSFRPAAAAAAAAATVLTPAGAESTGRLALTEGKVRGWEGRGGEGCDMLGCGAVRCDARCDALGRRGDPPLICLELRSLTC